MVDLKRSVSQIMKWLVAGDYQSIVDNTNGQRLDEDAIRKAIESYPYSLQMPPDEEVDGLLNIVQLKNADPAAFSIWIYCWTNEEGRSDLQVRMTLRYDLAGRPQTELDDILVA